MRRPRRFALFVVLSILLLAATPAIAGLRCALEQPNLEPSSIRFEMDGLKLKAFEAQTVISSDDPDLRPGYAAWTCHRSIEHFEQTIKGDLVLLKHRDVSEAANGESPACQVAFRVSDKVVRAFTSGCRTSCMMFDVTFQKRGKLCRDS